MACARETTLVLIEKLLEKGDKKSLKLAKIAAKNTYKYQDNLPRFIPYSIIRMNENVTKDKYRTYLYSLFNEKTKNEMINLDYTISECADIIPWFFSYYRDSFEHYENFINWNDPEFRECTRLRIIRTEKSFEPYDGYNESYLSRKERALIKEYQTIFAKLHRALTRQDRLIRSYNFETELDRDIAMILLCKLGYIKRWIEEEKGFIKRYEVE